MRQALGPAAFNQCEGSCDLTGRYMDLSEAGANPFFHYTHPRVLNVVFLAKCNAQEIAEAWTQGIVTLITAGSLDDEQKAELRKFVAARQRLRAAHAPGFPSGFCDEEGLRYDRELVNAKLFRGVDGITILYVANKDALITFEFDKKTACLLAGLPEQKTIQACANKLDFLILRANSA
jgi:hypothetical protein